MTHPDIITAALASRHTRASFRTLDRHHASGTFDRHAAIRLLLNNVRDAMRATGATLDLRERDKAAKELLHVWRTERQDAHRE